MDTAQPVTPTTKANRSRRRVLLALASAPLLPNAGIAQAGVWQRHTAVSTGTAMQWLKAELLSSLRQRQDAAHAIAARAH